MKYFILLITHRPAVLFKLTFFCVPACLTPVVHNLFGLSLPKIESTYDPSSGFGLSVAIGCKTVIFSYSASFI